MSLDRLAHAEESHRETSKADASTDRSGDTGRSTRAQAAELRDALTDPAAGEAEAAEVQCVQMDRRTSATMQASEVRSIAAEGLGGSSEALPHLGEIQKSFGNHDLSNVQAHVGGPARAAVSAIGAQAYTSGDKIAFKGTPDLWTAAHEAAHVVQQRSGVKLEGGVGKTGDAYEKNANAVADKVVAGKTAEGLLTETTHGAEHANFIQLLGEKLDETAKVTPAHGEDKGTQRRYSPEQYMKMWEEEQGRAMTDAEKKTIKRGCIGLTATNLNGGGNPLDSAEACWADFDKAHAEMTRKNGILDWIAKIPFFGKSMAGDERYILFAKLFWSNQDPDPQKRKKSDPKAFIPNAEGKVDMTGYEYMEQPGYVNFDYGWWDDTSQCFWHANHMDYGDPKDPMIVLQSTKDKFAKKVSHLGETRYGYIDFDRIIYCISLAKNYDPGLAAIASSKP